MLAEKINLSYQEFSKIYPLYPELEEVLTPREYSVEDVERLADELTNWMKKKSHLLVVGFFIKKGLLKKDVALFAERSERFAFAYELAMMRQESRLVEGALKNKLDSHTVKLILMSEHGWQEKRETELSSEKGSLASFLENLRNSTEKR